MANLGHGGGRNLKRNLISTRKSENNGLGGSRLTDLLAKHIESGGKPVHVNTIKDAMKSAKFVWKRTRCSLKNTRDEDAFRAKQIEIEQLREQATRMRI